MTGGEIDLQDPARQTAAAKSFECVVQVARSDQRIVGLVLGGGRGKGLATASSDYDCYIFISDDADPTEVMRFLDEGVPGVELGVQRFSQFRDEPPIAWNRYNFAYLEPIVDKSGGELRAVLAAFGSMSGDEATRAARVGLGAYVNQVYRAAKNHRDGMLLETRLDAAESVSWFVYALFAMYGRLRPYNKFLPWELQTHPLPEVPWKPELQLALIDRVLANGDVAAMNQMYRGLLEVAAARGYIDELRTEWGRTLDWLTEYGQKPGIPSSSDEVQR